MFELLLGAGFWIWWKGKWREHCLYTQSADWLFFSGYTLSVLAHLRAFTVIFFLMKPFFCTFILPSMNETCVLHLFTFNCHSCSSGLEKSRSWLCIYSSDFFLDFTPSGSNQSSDFLSSTLPQFQVQQYLLQFLSCDSLWKPPSTSGLTFLHMCSN